MTKLSNRVNEGLNWRGGGLVWFKKTSNKRYNFFCASLQPTSPWFCCFNPNWSNVLTHFQFEIAVVFYFISKIRQRVFEIGKRQSFLRILLIQKAKRWCCAMLAVQIHFAQFPYEFHGHWWKNHEMILVAKVIIYKSRGEPFLWNRMWDLGWSWGRLALLKISDWTLKYAIFEGNFWCLRTNNSCIT